MHDSERRSVDGARANLATSTQINVDVSVLRLQRAFGNRAVAYFCSTLGRCRDQQPHRCTFKGRSSKWNPNI
jgi:hypothetical protein